MVVEKWDSLQNFERNLTLTPLKCHRNSWKEFYTGCFHSCSQQLSVGPSPWTTSPMMQPWPWPSPPCWRGASGASGQPPACADSRGMTPAGKPVFKQSDIFFCIVFWSKSCLSNLPRPLWFLKRSQPAQVNGFNSSFGSENALQHRRNSATCSWLGRGTEACCLIRGE